MKTAIILGATGLTGGMLLQKLLKDNRYGKVVLFSRSKLEIEHPKIKEYIIDLFQLGKHRDKFFAEEVFCCVGSTKSKTPNKSLYRKVDYGIPVTAAKLCRENNIKIFIVISALGADFVSNFFYNKTKGEMEKAVLSQEIKNTYIFRPSLISGKREEKRLFELMWKQVMKVANYVMFGPLEKYQSVHAAIIADAMILVANEGYEKTIIESDEIKRITFSNSQ